MTLFFMLKFPRYARWRGDFARRWRDTRPWGGGWGRWWCTGPVRGRVSAPAWPSPNPIGKFCRPPSPISHECPSRWGNCRIWTLYSGGPCIPPTFRPNPCLKASRSSPKCLRECNVHRWWSRRSSLVSLKIQKGKILRRKYTEINQPTNQPTNQSINQSINPSMYQSIHQCINEWMNQSINQSIKLSN